MHLVPPVIFFSFYHDCIVLYLANEVVNTLIKSMKEKTKIELQNKGNNVKTPSVMEC